MNDTNVRKALIAAAEDFLTVAESIDTVGGLFEGLPILPAENVAWENRNFGAEGVGTWASVFYVPNIPEGRTIGPGGFDQLTGFIQIDINVAPDSGEGVHVEWEGKSRLYFPGGRVFSYGGQSVLVSSCGMSQGRTVENFYRKSITVAFRSHLKRNEVK